jgi:hypothetical protein
MRYGQGGDPAVAAADALELPPAFRGVEVTGWHQFESAGERELLGAAAAQKHVLGVLHHGTREFDRILDMRQAADRSGHSRGAVHDGGIQLVVAVESEHRAMARVEQRIVLEQHDGPRHRIEAGAAARKNGKAAVERCGEPRAIQSLSIIGHLGARQRAGTAVNR